MLSRERKAELVEVTLEMVSAGRAEFQRRCGNMLPESVAECEAAAIAIYGAMRRAMPEEGCGEAELREEAGEWRQAAFNNYAHLATEALKEWLGGTYTGREIHCWCQGYASALAAPPVAASPTGVGEESTAG